MAKIANIRLQNIHEAQDAVQETFLAAQKNIEKIMRSENPKGWLMNALKYSVKQQRRARTRFDLLEQKIKHNTAVYTADDTVNLELWNALPKDEYEILRLIYVEGYTRHEVADFLGITYETCKKRVQSAKRKLRGLLGA
jgi:RNA polymerase sigma-70 factor (ECF subfamily)